MSHDGVKNPLRILYLEDNLQDRELTGAALAAEGWACEFTHARTQAEFEQALQGSEYDLILSDFTLPSYDGNAALQAAQKRAELHEARIC